MTKKITGFNLSTESIIKLEIAKRIFKKSKSQLLDDLVQGSWNEPEIKSLIEKIEKEFDEIDEILQS